MKKNIIILILFMFLVCFLAPVYFMSCDTNNKKTEAGIQIFAFEYGKSLFSKKHIYYNDNSNDRVDFSWLFYLVKNGKQLILIDTGFNDHALIRAYQITAFQDPAALLAKIKITPEMITDVIITHSHFDHIGAVTLFKNARIYIQKDELNYLKHVKKNALLKNAYRFVETNKKLQLTDGALSLDKNVYIEKTGGHTPGTQIVFLKNGNKNYIFTGDECYLPEGCTNARLSGTVYNKTNNLKILTELQILAKDPDVILLTHHDPLLDKKFIRISKHIIQIL